MSYYFLMDENEKKDCGNSICFVEREAAYSAECFSDIPASVLSRLSLTEGKSCCNASGTESCQSSQYGTTCEPSMENHGEDSLMSCAPAVRVRDSAQAETCLVLKIQEVGSFPKSSELLARWDQASFSWRMCQQSLFSDYAESLERWPRWATASKRGLWELAAPVWTTCEKDSGWLPTPMNSDGKKWYVSKQTASFRKDNGHQAQLIHELIEYHGLKKGWANPEFWELMMDWPIGWTDLKPLETAKFQQWYRSHGKPCHSEHATHAYVQRVIGDL